MFFCSHSFVQNCFASFDSGFCFVFMHSSKNCSLDFISLFWKVFLCSYSFTQSSYLFYLSSFANILIYLFKLYFKICWLLFFGLFFSIYPCVFSLRSTFDYCRSFFIFPFRSHLSSRFCIFDLVPERNTNFIAN